MSKTLPQNPHSEPVDKCIETLIHFRDLLSFAMSKPSSILSVTANVDTIHEKLTQEDDGKCVAEEEIRETQITILFALWNSEKHFEKKVSRHEMLFSYSDVEERLGEVFKKWLKKREEYESVFDLLMTTMYTPGLYLNYGFLNIIQALEVYHSNKYEGTYQKDKAYKSGIYKKLLEVIEEFPGESIDKEHGISDDFRSALKGKLNFQNQFTLQTRLGGMLSDISFLLPDNFIGDAEDRKSFVSRASNTRHALTHHDKKQRRKAAKGQELSQLFHTLTVILQICLLRELSFMDDAIKDLIARNRAYQNEWHPTSK